jgi:hypothetical protein
MNDQVGFVSKYISMEWSFIGNEMYSQVSLNKNNNTSAYNHICTFITYYWRCDVIIITAEEINHESCNVLMQ